MHAAHRATRRTALVGLLLATLALGPASGAAASGRAAGGAASGNDAYIRVAHLVPGFGGVTMTATLTSFDGSTRQLTLAPEATYGAITPYEPLPAGSYAVAVRPVGASPSTAPVLTQTLTAQPGAAYTIAGLGDSTAPRLSALDDDLTSPGPGTARVRVLPAAEPGQTTDVTASGRAVATGAAFSEPTGYVDVPAGEVTFQASTGQRRGQETTTLAGGSVYTVLVLADGSTGITLKPVTDATGSGVVPRGGAATGGGYLAEHAADGSWAGPAASAAAGTALAGGALAVALALGRRRRGAHADR
ncbi:protein of unknown function [Quadrisphaera granulorum]|uniref:Uncharacterized protein DUF4397 n=1 Tax=Quadrisphaera granulorum TaxID=317664 RepID=A0A316A7R1_9ACTN|nr:DUF4397 domain-containing protein [Quadrisphaera granulorum]PWJ53966.1 uncharacterized protein DUF4397 [Quadrisphaera granulorum]SZE96423.1 protein of unknown function [Quadrisphaera granulorum]